MVPSSSAPPSTGQPGLWRRKSSTGAVDAQGNLLVHPMVSISYAYAETQVSGLIVLPQTWLDERLFGWSRSASRGTSAWAGTRSHDISRATSRAASPEVSDEEEEDTGDYDNLLYLDVAGTRARRSAQSSYADLQKIRRLSNAQQPPLPPPYGLAMTSSSEPGKVPDPDLDDDDVFVRQKPRRGSRTRRMSLSDKVSVERLRVVNKRKSFDEATNELNTEINQRRMSIGAENHLHQD